MATSLLRGIVPQELVIVVLKDTADIRRIVI